MKYPIWLVLMSLLWSDLSHSADDSPDWNETRIMWFSYEAGLELARETGKPVLLVFYASWCHACHSYRDLFHDPEIETLARDLVMIRVNADSRPDLNSKFSADGLYLPRSFGLSSNGKLLALTSNSRHFRYFYAVNDITAYGRLMQSIARVELTPM